MEQLEAPRQVPPLPGEGCQLEAERAMTAAWRSWSWRRRGTTDTYTASVFIF